MRPPWTGRWLAALWIVTVTLHVSRQWATARLIGSPSYGFRRLDVYHNGEWRPTLCEDHVFKSHAKVVCKTFGYNGSDIREDTYDVNVTVDGNAKENYYTSRPTTTPLPPLSPNRMFLQTLRFRLKSNQSAILGIWYSQSNRRDVYLGNDLVLAKNTRIVKGKYVDDRQSRPGEFHPDVNDVTGTNYFDRDTYILYVLVRGNSVVNILTNPSLIVSIQIPASTPEEFYGEALVHRLALFFDVPAEKIRVVDAVRETGRKRRDVDGNIKVVSEIGDPPTAGVNATQTLTTDALLNKSAMFINTVQGGGNIGEALNLTISGIAVTEPPINNGLDPPRADTSGEITVPKTLNISVPLAPTYETAPFSIQPCLRVFDLQNKPMKKLGSIGDPWRITAYLTSGADGSVTLQGTTTVDIVGGWANFTDLALSHYGEDFIIIFNKTYPDNAIDLSVLSESFSVNRISIGLNIISTSIALVNKETTIKIELLDNTTQNKISNITWRGHTWTATLDFDNNLASGNMTEFNEAQFNHSTGDVVFNDFVFDQIGIYFLRFHVKSSPEEYDLYRDFRVEVLNDKQLDLSNDSTAPSTNISLTFNESYSEVVGDSSEQFGAMIVNRLAPKYTDVYFGGITVRPGSIVLGTVMTHQSYDINTTLQSICKFVESETFVFNGTTLTHPKLHSNRKAIIPCVSSKLITNGYPNRNSRRCIRSSYKPVVLLPENPHPVTFLI